MAEDLIKKVVGFYASGTDGLSQEECAELMMKHKFNEHQCTVLQKVLGFGSAGSISPADIADLRKAKFSEEDFIKKLITPDVNRALRHRAKWLSDFYMSKKTSSETEKKVIENEVMDMGAAATTAVPVFVKIIQKGESKSTMRAIEALAKMGPKARNAIPTLGKVLQGENAKLAIAAAKTLGLIGDELAIYDLALGFASGSKRVRAAVSDAFEIMKINDEEIIKNLIWIMEGKQGESIKQRGYAAASVGRFGKEAARARVSLVKLLKGDDEDLRYFAAYGLVQMATEESVTALVNCKTTDVDNVLVHENCLIPDPKAKAPPSDHDVRVRRASAYILGRRKSTYGVSALEERLIDDKDAKVRINCAVALGQIGEKGSVRILSKALGDKEDRVIVAAAKALERIGPDSKRAVPALIKCIETNRTDLIIAAANALGAIGPKAKRAMSVLAPLLSDLELEVKKSGTRAMLRINPKRALREMRAMGGELGSLKVFLIECLKDSDDNVKKAAMIALGNLETEAADAVPALTDLVQLGSDSVRKTAIYVLGRLGPAAKDAAPFIGDALRAGGERERMAAADALGRIGTHADETVPALLVALGDKSKRVRATAKKALGGIDAIDLLAAVMNAFQSDDEEVVGAAAAYVAGMGKGAKDALPSLVKMLSAGSDVQKIAIAGLIGRIGVASPDIVRALVSASWSENEELTAAAKAAVNKLNAGELVSSFTVLMNDEGEEEAVRLVAVSVLFKLAHARGDAAVALAEGLSIKKRVVTKEIFKGLIQLGPKAEAAVPVLARALGSSNPAIPAFILSKMGSAAAGACRELLLVSVNEHDVVRNKAEEALNAMSDKIVAKELVKAISDESPDLRRAALFHMIKRELVPTKAVPSLLLMSLGEDKRLARGADIAIRKVRTDKLVRALAKCLRHENPKARLRAAYCLMRLGSAARPALKALRRAAKDEDARVRRMAELAVRSVKKG